MQSKIELARIRDFGEIINDTFSFVRQNIKPLLKYFFTFCGVFVLGTIISACLFQVKSMGFVNSIRYGAYSSNEYRPSIFNFFGIEYVLMIIFGILSFTTILVTFLSYIAIYKQKNNVAPTTEEMWGYIKHYYLKILGSNLLISLILGISVLFCIVPFFYLAPILALIFPIMVIENTSLGYAFSRSFTLIKDNWWVTFGALVVIWIIVYVAMMIVTVPASIINMISLTTVAKTGTSAVSLITGIVTAVLQQLCQVFMVIPITALSLCYFNLTESKDGTSLMEKISQLGNTKPETDLPAEEY